VTHNASFNCLAAKLVVVAKGWKQREQFMARVAHHLQVCERESLRSRALLPTSVLPWQGGRAPAHL